MAVLGFDDDVWFGLQNSQNGGFSQAIVNMNMGFNNNSTNPGLYNNININNSNNNHNTQFFPSSSRFEAVTQTSLDSQLEFQRQEIDCILHFQNEKLRTALQEQRKQQLSSLVNILETKASCLMKQKDEDLARATRRGLELQERLRRAETESQTWQRIARAKEASVIELNNALQQAMIIGKNDNDNDNNVNNNNNYVNDNGAEDAQSGTCFGSSEELLLLHGSGSTNDNQKWVCKVCKYRSSCVVFLPCKHLCSCKACEAFLGSCPVCESVKESSFEVLFV